MRIIRWMNTSWLVFRRFVRKHSWFDLGCGV
jgi:hypothetical protein